MAGEPTTKSTVSTARAKMTMPLERKRATIGATTKRLPWLDGKPSRFIAASPDSLIPTDIPSPTTTLYCRKRSSPTLPTCTTTDTLKRDPVVRPMGSTPPLRKKSLATPSSRKVVSVGNNSPSPVTRHRTSQVRRASLAQQTASPSKEQKRLSLAHHLDKDLEEDSAGKFRPHADSLVPLRDHQKRSITPSSIKTSMEHDITMPPVIVSRVQISPAQPIPGRSTLEKVDSRKVSNAIEGLEHMVQEAVELTENTSNQAQVEEIYDIIQDARNAVEEASGDPTRQLMATVSPLEASGFSDEEDEDALSSFTSRSSSNRYPEHSMPGRTPPLPPAFVESNILGQPIDSVPKVGLHRDSTSFDWAYPRPKSLSQNTSSSSSSKGEKSEDRGRSEFSTRSDLLLPPQPSQTAPREHVDFVLRPVTRDESRGRSRWRFAGESRSHRHRRHKSFDNGSRSRNRRPRSSSFGRLDTSFDEENPPAKKYGGELTVREQAHYHTFSLRRHHRRQPIARNWSTGKKRLTATIACLNTALLGIVVGVYACCSCSKIACLV